MKRIEMSEADSRAVYRALEAGITHSLRRLAQARYRVKAALDLGEDPDKRDVADVEYQESALAALRRAKRQIEDREEAEE